ncbi:MAG: hypothetical protein ACMG6E_01110 [Candidatus Roizmanbacteria bacterium]
MTVLKGGHFTVEVSAKYPLVYNKDNMAPGVTYRSFSPSGQYVSDLGTIYKDSQDYKDAAHAHPLIVSDLPCDKSFSVIEDYMKGINEKALQNNPSTDPSCPGPAEAIKLLGITPMTDETIMRTALFFNDLQNALANAISQVSEPNKETQKYYITNSNIHQRTTRMAFSEDKSIGPRTGHDGIDQETLKNNFRENKQKLLAEAEKRKKDLDLLKRSLALAMTGGATWYGARELRRFIKKKSLDVKTGSLLFSNFFDETEQDTTYRFFQHLSYAQTEMSFSPLPRSASPQTRVFEDLVGAISRNRLKKYLKHPSKFETKEMSAESKAKMRLLAGLILTIK